MMQAIARLSLMNNLRSIDAVLTLNFAFRRTFAEVIDVNFLLKLPHVEAILLETTKTMDLDGPGCSLVATFILR